jgi:hypothetical protein
MDINISWNGKELWRLLMARCAYSRLCNLNRVILLTPISI